MDESWKQLTRRVAKPYYVTPSGKLTKKYAVRRIPKTFKNKVRRVVNSIAEKKYLVTTSGGPQNVDYSGTVASISDVPQGLSDSGREGDQIYLRSIEFSWQAFIGDTFNVLRLIVFQWYPPTTPTVADIILATAVGSTDIVFAPYNHDKRYNYKILYDKTVSLDAVKANTSGVIRKYIIKGFKRHIQYEATGTTGTNKIYILKASDSAAVSHPQMQNYHKINYSDA